MRPIGFSTGSLAFGNFRLGLKIVHGKPTAAIELSALRESELAPLIEAIDQLELTQFSYVSVHAPSKFSQDHEKEIVSQLQLVASRRWPIVVHPDTIYQFELWEELGDLVCIENMDKRKRTGRTARELASSFEKLPEASLCFDVGHARQIDPTMLEAELILKHHGSRLKQLHVSDVTSQSTHEPLSLESILAFRRISHLIPESTPVILETPVSGNGIVREIERVKSALSYEDSGSDRSVPVIA